MKKKITAIALAVCILVVGVIGATMAYFTDTKQATNTFTFGKGVEITLTENGTAATSTDGKTLLPAKETGDSTTGLTYDKVVPGAYYAKKPTVTLANDCAESYIVVSAKCDADYPVKIGGYDTSKADVEIVGDTYYFFFKNTYKANDTVSAFEWVQVDPSLNNADVEAGNRFNVEVNAYAILAAGFNSCKEAFNAAFGEVTGDVSETETATQTASAGVATEFTVPVAPQGGESAETKVAFAAGALTAGDEYTVTATTYGVESSAANFKIVGDSDVIAAIDVNLTDKDGNKAEFTGTATITTFIAKGLTSNPQVIYNGVGNQPTVVSYDAGTGKLVFTTDHFSTYLVTVAQADAFNQTTGAVYAKLSDAIAASAKGDVIVMLKDVDNATGITVDSGKEFTVDFNGHTYTLNKPGAGSAGTKTIGFQLLEGSKITFQNGTIKCAAENKNAIWDKDSTEKGIAMMIQNYADLTLKKMTVDGTNIAHNGAATRYVLSNNCGNVLYDGCTIIAAEGDFAFDTCKYGSYAAPTVTVKNTKVTGKVDISGGNFVDAGNNTFSDDGNWYVESEPVFTLYTAAQLKDFAAKVNAGNTFSGKTVKLGADIDLKGIAWTPIGGVSAYPSVTFYGTFDGQNHVISNLKATDDTANYAAAGFFGSLMGTVKDLTLKNVDITSSHWAGGIVAYSSSSGSKVENCTVDGGTITSAPELIGQEYDNGDKVGGIFGYNGEGGPITGCTVKNVTLKGYRDIGGIVGASRGTVSNNNVQNVTIIQDDTNGYKADPITTYSQIIGSDLGVTPTDTNTYSNVTLKTK